MSTRYDQWLTSEPTRGSVVHEQDDVQEAYDLYIEISTYLKSGETPDFKDEEQRTKYRLGSWLDANFDSLRCGECKSIIGAFLEEGYYEPTAWMAFEGFEELDEDGEHLLCLKCSEGRKSKEV